jgi:hypothetical protein
MENPYGLRLARRDDFDALLAFVLPIIQEDAVQPVSVDKISAMVARCIGRAGAVAGIVSGPQGIEASVGATIDEFEYTDESHLMVRWLGVAPAFRKSDRPARLLNYVRWLHEAMGDQAVPVFLPALTTTDQAGKVSLYERRAPRVGVLHAFGCLPDRSFIPARVGRGNGRATGARSEPVAAGPIPKSA